MEVGWKIGNEILQLDLRDTSTPCVPMSRTKVGEDLWKNRVEKVVCILEMQTCH